ncbi:potassium-transporting ATPase subunit KdpA [Francisella philomiragia]|uniref:Potassium-transporting ATPase potassium-binding subunit n=1 Tax=Francisella philomiragia subsp. philomiragia (strain ATCC 25017 / CCUG 19701 / FSC 153 / O\|nr:potassium-transporting ATPase subunit KdpA [Francisella philomiragia]B0TWK0.1 RecName: Full=Potassium-transporting ATPase potassium-binding subunit; AltName: Full=ATP phosphohydrolase [potassium-transporting] A chain; AltName: Full=Potassium-binding and translocating subunit A; AltName: Full=Potassium-translocating ATPase A chain [Francisella philomiragia subsp. philomiragia ATCC 25017]AJI47000.1 K+-transporting ATPase, A subunit [Francisella philomiragia]AJI49986.1 K+-transporting ATPase, A 
MSYNFILFVVFIFTLVIITKPLGTYIFKVFNNERTWLDWFAKPFQRVYLLILGESSKKEQSAKSYFFSLLSFSIMAFIFVFVVLLLQGLLPFNPQEIKGMGFSQAFNTAVSFVTNTNWQSYSGETGVSHFSQMLALAVQNFVSAAVGLCVAIVLIRSVARHEATKVGNFWNDLGKAIFWILLPISIIIAIVYIFQGVPQNIMAYLHVHTLAGSDQIIAQGPIASQEAIKSLGTNGGGFFNANSAHPYENPTIITNYIQMVSIFAIAAALTYTFGKWVGNTKQGWMIFAVMLVLFVISLMVMTISELHGLDFLHSKNIQDIYGQVGHLSNMEGKETRFGIFNSTLYNTVSTSASDGGVNSVMDSYSAIGGMMAMLNMAIGEVIFGGIGAGFYGFFMFLMLAVFIGSLMIGRAPSFLGKRIEANDMKWTMFALLISPCCVLVFTGLAAVIPSVHQALTNSGAHGFSEILYAYISGSNNNGSAFAGLAANTSYLNITIALSMLIGRFGVIFAVMMLAGSLVKKKRSSQMSEISSLDTTSFIFSVLVFFTIVLIGGLTIFPALSLGPILDQLNLNF